METLKKYRTYFLGEGSIFLALGVLAIVLPFYYAFDLTIGWILICAGVIQFGRGFATLKVPGFGLSLACAIAYIVGGILVLEYPVQEEALPTFISLTVMYLVLGILLTCYGFTTSRWLRFAGFVTGAGVITIFTAYVVWNLHDFDPWVTGIVVGVQLILYAFCISMFGLKPARVERR